MNIKKISGKITVRPTNKKMREAKQTVKQANILPKEIPVEKKIYFHPLSESFERIKDYIQISIENMKGQK